MSVPPTARRRSGPAQAALGIRAVYADNGGISALLDKPMEWLTHEAQIAATVPRYVPIGQTGGTAWPG